LETRSAFGKALADWNRGEPVQSQEAALRQYVNQSQSDRIAKAAAGQAVHYAGISRTAKAIGIGGHNAKQGGGAAYRRGAFSKAQAMEIEAGKLRIAATNAAHARVKLPSQR
jgi:hypothetical protein